MGLFRKVQTSTWDDPYIEQQTPEGKYFWNFLLTNPLSTECGIYEISTKKMCYWLGYNEETVNKLISKFEQDEKIIYNRDTSEIAIINRGKYLNRAGKPVIDCIISELQKVKDKNLILAVSRNVIRGDIKVVYDSFTNRNTIRPTLRGEEKEEEKEEHEVNESFTTREEEIQKMWIKTLGRNPKYPEVEETEKLIDQFGIKKVEKIFRDAALRNIKSIQYLLDNIDEKTGELKPFTPINGKAVQTRRELPEL